MLDDTEIDEAHFDMPRIFAFMNVVPKNRFPLIFSNATNTYILEITPDVKKAILQAVIFGNI